MTGKWHMLAGWWIAVFLLIGCGSGNEESVDGRLARYQREVAEDPSDAEAHYELGRAYYEQTRYAQALQVFRRARTLNSAHVGAQIGIGKVLLVRGELPGAREALSLIHI